MTQLSDREMQVLKLLAHPNKVIAHKLDCAESTVKIHVKAICRKVGVYTRTKLLVHALRTNLITLEDIEL